MELASSSSGSLPNPSGSLSESGALWIAAELEEEWQSEQWGRDAEAEERRTRRAAAFANAVRFAALARND